MTHLTVRAHECDSLGHVNNAVYLHYLQEATLDFLRVVGDNVADLAVQSVSLHYHTPARSGDELRIVTWVIGATNGVACLYRISRVSDGRDVVTARMTWVTSDSEVGPARPVGWERVLLPSDETPAILRPFVVPSDNGARPFRWRTRVRRYEVGLNGQVGVATYFNWLEEATFRAAEVVGCPLGRMRDTDLVIVQYRHDAEIVGSLSAGDEVEIASRLMAVRRVRGTWEHLVRRVHDSALVLRDYSTGTFLTSYGTVRTLPPELVTALQAGEPASAAAEA